MKLSDFSKLLIFTLLFPFLSNAQAVNWLIETPATGSEVCSDEFSNVYTCGRFMNSVIVGGVTYTSAGVQDVLIQKRDQMGNPSWATQIGNANTDQVTDITYDGYGNVWIIGTFSGTLSIGSFTLDAIGGLDMYVVKLNASNGTILFAQSGGSFYDEDNGRIAADAQGNIYISGIHKGNFTFGTQSISGLGGFDVYLMKLDNAGNVVYVSGYSGTGSDSLHSMTVDNLNNVYIIGITTSTTVDFNGNNQNFTYPSGVYLYNIFSKFDANGNYIFHKKALVNGEIVDCSTDAQGNLYFTGNTEATATFGTITLTSSTSDDILLGKMSYNGIFEWVKSIGGTSTDGGFAIETTASGNSYVALRYQGIVDFEVENANAGSESKSAILKIDNLGNVKWVVLGSGSSTSWSTGIALAPNETIYSCGAASGDLTMGQETITSATSYLVKVQGNANIAKGTVYLDNNSNGLQEVGENGIPNVLVQLDNSNYVSSTNNNGNYQSYTIAGNHTLSIPYPPLYHSLTTPTSQSANFTGLGQVDALNDFGFVATPGMNDLFIDIAAITNPKAGYIMGYQISYKNTGTTNLNTSIEFTADNMLTFSSASTVPTITNGQVYTWNMGVVNAQTQGNITVLFQIPTNTSLGAPITSSAIISPISSDQTPANNTYSITRNVTGPYDPNFKEVNIVEFTNILDAETLEYTIHFQNLGNAPAQNVIILDTLSDFLINASAKIISASHSPLNFSIAQGNVAKFYFPNIQLPDSLSNPIGSMGFVKLSIKHDGTVPVNSSIDNFGDIYFDYNDPIRTNTAITLHVTETVGLNEEAIEKETLTAYPVPANSEITISFKDDFKTSFALSLVDGNGKEIQQMKIFPNNSSVTINLENVKPGVYFIQSKGVFETKKIVVW